MIAGVNLQEQTMPQAAAISRYPSELSEIPLQLNAEVASPSQVREWVAELFEKNHINLAVALAESGLALYPDSEDVLVISALVSEVQQDWPRSIEILEHLIEVQAGNTPAEVWHHLARTLRCDGQYPRAHAVAQQALQRHPGSAELMAMVQELSNAYPN
jgi:tetratricopeptide (TPR) repeat protein